LPDGRPAGPIKRYWWSKDTECKIDAANNRARFVFAWTETSTYEILAFGIEILGAEALWSAKSTIPHAGGRDPDHDWEGAARYVDQHVADYGPLRRHKTGENAGNPIDQHAVDLMLVYFNNPNGPPLERTVQKWVTSHPERCRHWWG
jgi:hypothetical protein